MNKRNLFAELTEGFDALAQARAGKKTLRTHEVTTPPAPTCAALTSTRRTISCSASPARCASSVA